jgi:hypothetical protein
MTEEISELTGMGHVTIANNFVAHVRYTIRVVERYGKGRTPGTRGRKLSPRFELEIQGFSNLMIPDLGILVLHLEDGSMLNFLLKRNGKLKCSGRIYRDLKVGPQDR